MPDGFLVDESFNREYNDIASRVLGPISSASASNGYETQPTGSIYVKITEVVDKIYTAEAPIEFKAKQVHFRIDGTTVDGRLLFDADITESEGSDRYNLGKNLHGLGIEWDETDIPAAKDKWEGLLLTASAREIVEADGLGENATVTNIYNVWAIDSAPPGESGGVEFFDCVVKSSTNAANYIVDVYTDAIAPGATPIKVGAKMIIEGATGLALPNDEIVFCRKSSQNTGDPEPAPPTETIYRPSNLWRYGVQ